MTHNRQIMCTGWNTGLWIPTGYILLKTELSHKQADSIMELLASNVFPIMGFERTHLLVFSHALEGIFGKSY